MFTFIKKLFGFDQPTMKDAGVQIEQAPYKVPEPVAVTPIPLVVETPPVPVVVSDTVTIAHEAVMPNLVSDTIVTEPVPIAKSATPKSKKKPANRKPKPVAEKKATSAKPRGRRPKSQA